MEGHLAMKLCHIGMYEITESIYEPKCVNGIGTFENENALHGRTSIRWVKVLKNEPSKMCEDSP